MKNIIGAVFALLCAPNVQAALVIQDVNIWIDKPDYSARYSIGMEAYVSSDLPLLDVVATHDPYTSGSAGTWSLDNISGDRWWAWSGSSALYSEGAIDGRFTVSASDGTSTATASIEVPLDAELDFISGYQISETSLGYSVTANSVFGADYYNLWVWDPIDKVYAYEQTSLQIDGLGIVPYDSLLGGREYRFYLNAVNPFSGGTFRTTSQLRVTNSPVPIPAAVWLFGSGLLGLVGVARRKKV